MFLGISWRITWNIIILATKGMLTGSLITTWWSSCAVCATGGRIPWRRWRSTPRPTPRSSTPAATGRGSSTGSEVIKIGPEVFKTGPWVIKIGPEVIRTDPEVIKIDPEVIDTGPGLPGERTHDEWGAGIEEILDIRVILLIESTRCIYTSLNCCYELI